MSDDETAQPVPATWEDVTHRFDLDKPFTIIDLSDAWEMAREEPNAAVAALTSRVRELETELTRAEAKKATVVELYQRNHPKEFESAEVKILREDAESLRAELAEKRSNLRSNLTHPSNDGLLAACQKHVSMAGKWLSEVAVETIAKLEAELARRTLRWGTEPTAAGRWILKWGHNGKEELVDIEIENGRVWRVQKNGKLAQTFPAGTRWAGPITMPEEQTS